MATTCIRRASHIIETTVGLLWAAKILTKRRGYPSLRGKLQEYPMGLEPDGVRNLTG